MQRLFFETSKLRWGKPRAAFGLGLIWPACEMWTSSASRAVWGLSFLAGGDVLPALCELLEFSGGLASQSHSHCPRTGYNATRDPSGLPLCSLYSPCPLPTLSGNVWPPWSPCTWTSLLIKCPGACLGSPPCAAAVWKPLPGRKLGNRQAHGVSLLSGILGLRCLLSHDWNLFPILCPVVNYYDGIFCGN